MFIDVHCHLDLCGDINSIIKKCEENGVGRILTHGVDKRTNKMALELQKRHEIVGACLGIYPEDALRMKDSDIEGELDFIRKNEEKILAIGEIGLDFKDILGEKDKEKQLRTFVELVKRALEINKPVIVHSRKAEKECIEVLERLNARKVIMHCFSGNMALVERIKDNGWYLSIPGNVTFSEHFQSVVKNIKIENLLCETDSPFLHPIKGKRDNDPSNVIESYKKIAEIKEISLQKCENQIEKNYRKIFN